MKTIIIINELQINFQSIKFILLVCLVLYYFLDTNCQNYFSHTFIISGIIIRYDNK